ncbi:MAG: amino acid racemase [Oscillospiraceae bacterium]|nr:amino acid racemase [Oscillospiraceae bacterium]
MTQAQQKTLGVIGGLGPIATSHFMELVIRMTDAQRDQQHLDMVIYHTPSIPDRSSFILDPTLPSPLESMIDLGRRLSEQGVGCIAIPCVTAHYFHESLSQAISVPIIHAPQETAIHLQNAGIRTVGIMATDGTVSSGIFQKELEKRGITRVIPSKERQKDVMHLIFECIKANRPADMARFRQVAEELRENGAEVIILGCTELSLIKRDHYIGAGFLDALEVLAQQAVVRCGAPLKKNYDCLITK